MCRTWRTHAPAYRTSPRTRCPRRGTRGASRTATCRRRPSSAFRARSPSSRCCSCRSRSPGARARPRGRRSGRGVPRPWLLVHGHLDRARSRGGDPARRLAWLPSGSPRRRPGGMRRLARPARPAGTRPGARRRTHWIRRLSDRMRAEAQALHAERGAYRLSTSAAASSRTPPGRPYVSEYVGLDIAGNPELTEGTIGAIRRRGAASTSCSARRCSSTATTPRRGSASSAG